MYWQETLDITNAVGKSLLKLDEQTRQSNVMRQFAEDTKRAKESLEGFAASIKTSLQSPHEQHIFRRLEIEKALKAGLLTQTQAEKAITASQAVLTSSIINLNTELDRQLKTVNKLGLGREREIALLNITAAAYFAYGEGTKLASMAIQDYMKGYDKLLKMKLQAEKMQAGLESSNMLGQLEKELYLTGMIGEARERAAFMMQLEESAKAAYGEGSAKYLETLATANNLLDDIAKKQQLVAIAEGIGDAFASAFEDMALGAATAAEAIRALAQDVSRLVMRQMVTQPIANAISGGVQPILSSLSAGFMNFFTPMAAGGLVTSPTPILAGEAGPEAIIPLAKLNRQEQTGGGTVTNIFNITTPDADSFRKSRSQIIRDYQKLRG